MGHSVSVVFVYLIRFFCYQCPAFIDDVDGLSLLAFNSDLETFLFFPDVIDLFLKICYQSVHNVYKLIFTFYLHLQILFLLLEILAILLQDFDISLSQSNFSLYMHISIDLLVHQFIQSPDVVLSLSGIVLDSFDLSFSLNDVFFKFKNLRTNNFLLKLLSSNCFIPSSDGLSLHL